MSDSTNPTQDANPPQPPVSHMSETTYAVDLALIIVQSLVAVQLTGTIQFPSAGGPQSVFGVAAAPGEPQSNMTYGDATGGDTFVLNGGAASLVLFGSNDRVFLNNTVATIYDQAHGLEVSIGGSLSGTDTIVGALADPSLAIDLRGGIGGYATPAAVLAALTSDGHGGTMLALGTGGTLDFVGAAPSHFTAASFHIG